MLFEFHIAILLREDGSSRRERRKCLFDELRVGHLLSAKTKLGDNSMKLRIERNEVGEVQHPQVDPVCTRLGQKESLLVMEARVQLSP